MNKECVAQNTQEEYNVVTKFNNAAIVEYTANSRSKGKRVAFHLHTFPQTH
jgi:hypothetical protein